mgnify:CR=1 FL=1
MCTFLSVVAEFLDAVLHIVVGVHVQLRVHFPAERANTVKNSSENANAGLLDELCASVFVGRALHVIVLLFLAARGLGLQPLERSHVMLLAVRLHRLESRLDLLAAQLLAHGAATRVRRRWRDRRRAAAIAAIR